MPRIGQICVRCRNLEKSVGFYKDVLGLEEFMRLGTADRPIAILKGGPVDLELVQTSPADKPLEVEGRSGFNHFAFFVRNMDEIVSDLKKKGVKFVSEPRESITNIKAAFFEDPDGVRIELLQFTGARVGK